MNAPLIFVAALATVMPPAARCEPPPQWHSAAGALARDNGCPARPQVLAAPSHHEEMS